MELATIIAGIVFEGMKLWGKERQRSFQKKHKQVLDQLDNERNAYFPEYSDAKLALAEREKVNFLRAYWKEMEEHNNEVEKSK